MSAVYLTVIGILLAIAVFAVKAGVGCGCSTIDRRQLLTIAGMYFVLSVIIGVILNYVDISYLLNASQLGMGLHVIMALLLLGVGIYTSKKWNCGVDVSHKTFLVISLPCPVCLAALFMSIMLLSNTVEISSALLGLGVGVIFFGSIISSSLVVRRFKKDPTTLGNAMTFLGLFYLMGAVIAPAYMHAKQMGLPTFSGPEFDIIPFIGFAILILGGFALNRIKTQH